MNLLTFDEIIRLLRAKDLGLMTEDAVANQILKYRELEKNQPQVDSRVMIVEFSEKGKRLRDGLLNNDGSVEWLKKYK